MSSEEEKKPLLSSTNPTPSAPPVEQPPPYEQPTLPAPLPESNGSALPGQQPPPYSTVNAAGGMSGQTMFVQCRVCQHVIHVSSESHTRVVKCSNCREATPIAPPPPGKKYVRCPCNCLLTCSANASRVVCPRENCKRTIGVGTIDVRPINMDRIRVVCGRCHKAILWPSNASIARCPHCRGRSYLYSSWMRSRAIASLIIGIVFIIIASALTGGTYAWSSAHGGIYVVWVGLFISGAAFIARAVFYCIMTQSHVER